MAADSGIDIAAERLRLDAERKAIEQQFVVERAHCYQLFDVNQCLTRMNQRERDALGVVRRQERVLNTDERKRRAGDEIRKIEDRNSTQTMLSAEDARASRAREQQERQGKTAVRQPGNSDLASPAAPLVTRKPPKPALAPAATPSVKEKDAQAKRAAFERKQQEAAEHRADVENRRAERKGALSDPLPPAKQRP